MKAPADLGDAGRAAWSRAVEAISDQESPERLVEAVTRYAYAVDLVARARSEWVEEGRPFAKASGSALHPLVKAMQEGDALAARYGEALGLKPGRVTRRGPDPVVVIAPSPAEMLRRGK